MLPAQRGLPRGCVLLSLVTRQRLAPPWTPGGCPHPDPWAARRLVSVEHGAFLSVELVTPATVSLLSEAPPLPPRRPPPVPPPAMHTGRPMR
eukprot:COSAG01_NODE_6940_length_3430_cov_2.386971_1_plen_92_part_00